MTTPPPSGAATHPRPGASQNPPRVPTLGEASREVGRGLGQGLLELVMWMVAVAVVVGGPALLGWWLAGGWGAVVGALLGAAVLGVTFVVLILKGVSLAAVVLRRR